MSENPVQIGIDIGGTFTDCAVIDRAGNIASAKAPTTHEDPARGFFDALEVVARERGSDVKTLLADATDVFHGTTVGTNAILERTGTPTGVLTTRGIGDSLAIMRGHGRVAGVPVEQIMRASMATRPAPLVPQHLVREVDERIDVAGKVVVVLDEDGVARAARELAETGVGAIAICFLWSFVNPAHELRAAEIAREESGLYVSCSSALVPKWGEYERLAATAINCYVGPSVERYVRQLTTGLKERDYDGQALFLDCGGGVMTARRAISAPLRTIDSGPAGGIVGAARLAADLGAADVICTDMGGTSFDVGLIVDEEPVRASKTVLAQYEYFVPRLDIRSIGAGGGSYVRYDSATRTLKVGPDSAGSAPGPICYRRGGVVPTVTDADVVLGFVNPDYFLAGRIDIDRGAAIEAFQEVGGAIGLSAAEAAAGACRIIDHRMADLIRQMTVQRGRDPRDFAIFCYGGAGPVHAGAYARELGCREVVVPLGDASSVWSAYGAAHSDLSYTAEVTNMRGSPFDEVWFNEQLARAAEAAVEVLAAEGAPEQGIVIARSVGMRYRGQLYEVTIPVPTFPCTAAVIESLCNAFEARYEELYGSGAGFREAGLEVVTFRADGAVPLPRGPLRRSASRSTAIPSDAKAARREVYWQEHRRASTTPVFWGEALAPGNVIEGPAILDLRETTVVVRPDQAARVEEYGSIVLSVQRGGN